MKVRVTSEATPSPACGVSQDDVRFPVPGFYPSSAAATPTGSSQARTVTSWSMKMALSTVGRTGRRGAVTERPALSTAGAGGACTQRRGRRLFEHVCHVRYTLGQPCWTR